MKILFILENTIKNLEGGTEVSSFHLASLLKKRGLEVEDWTPYRKRKIMYFYTSFLGQLYIFIKLLCNAVKSRPQILHIHGKYLIPPAVLAGKILKIPSTATIRDYIAICPIGLCLFQASKKHNFSWYIKKEIPEFLKIYHPKDNHIIKIFKIIFLIRAWYVTKWFQFWLKKTNAAISVSKHVQRVLDIHGIKSQVIYNAFDTGLFKDCPLLTEDSPLENDRKNILFVGKPSYGKGYDLFKALSQEKLFKKYKFITIGGKNKLGYVDTLKKIKQALTVVVPSRWSEPFGRAALESIMLGVPVLTTNRGGLPEIIKDKEIGLVTEPNKKDLAEGLLRIIDNNSGFRLIIRKKREKLRGKFTRIPIDQHIKLYNNLLSLN